MMKTELSTTIRVGLLSKGINQARLAEDLDVSEMQVSRWMTGKSFPDKENLYGLAQYFGWPSAKIESIARDWLRMQGSLSTRSGPALVSVRSLNETRNLGVSDSLLFKTIDDIWSDFPLPDVPGNDMGTDEKWQAIYNLCPEMIRVIFHGERDIIGYWHVVVLGDSNFAKTRKGENINSSLQPGDVITPWEPGDYNLYFVDLVVKEGKRGNMAISRAIQVSFFEFLLEYANAEIFFSSILANVSSAWMHSICQHPGFKMLCSHVCHQRFSATGKIEPTEIFEVDLKRREGRLLLRSHIELHSAYERHFGSSISSI